MIDLIFYLEYAEMQRLSGHYQCGYVLHIFMVVQNYCLLNRYKIHHSLCRDRRSKQKAEKDFLQAREGRNKNSVSPCCQLQNDHVSHVRQRLGRDYRDDNQSDRDSHTQEVQNSMLRLR